jgi:hypothetical protein
MSTSASSRERLGGIRFGRIAVRGLLLLILGIPVTGLRAQQTESGPGDIEPLDITCLDTFESGRAEELIRICISKHGNLVRFESPAGFEHIRNGLYYEGYVLCSDAGTTLNGWDNGQNGGRFDDGTVSQPGGPGTLPIIVTRNTLDGLFQLTQTFTWDPANNQVFIEMQVENVSGAKQFDVDLMRLVDLDVGNNVTGGTNEGGTTLDSVFAWNDFGSLTGTLAPQALRLSAATRKTAHFANLTLLAGDVACAPSTIVPPTTGDINGRVTYNLGTIPKNGTKTVTFTYRRF